MAKQGKAAVTPRLRFPEYRGSEDWTKVELRRLAVIINERVGATRCTPYTITSGVGLVSQQEKLGRTIAGNSLKNYIVLQRDDFAYNKSATKAFPQGFVARYVGEERAAVPNSIFTCFRVKEDKVAPAFLDDLFATNLHGSWLRSRIAVGARAHGSLNVSDDDLMDLPVPLPGGSSSLAEQQKIADCLTSLDEVIAAQGRKVEALKAHKRGLMQQLFPREGETRPRLRFPEFRDARDLEVKLLGELVKFSSGGTPSKAAPTYWDGDIPWISASSMHDMFIEDADQRVTKEAIGNGTRLARKGCILVLVRGSMLFKRVPICISTRDVAFNQDVKALAVLPDMVAMFLLYQLVAMSPRIPINETGIGAGKIETEVLENLEIWVPGIAEQQRIADCLSSLDTRITAETHQLAALKTHKQGLMQQLFPAPEAAKA